MTSTAPTRRFWTTLGIINVVALLYPIVSLTKSDRDSEQFFAALIVITVLFLLCLADAIAITLAYALCEETR